MPQTHLPRYRWRLFWLLLLLTGVPVLLLAGLAQFMVTRLATAGIRHEHAAFADRVATDIQAQLIGSTTVLDRAAQYLGGKNVGDIRRLLNALPVDDLESVLLLNDRGVVQYAATRSRQYTEDATRTLVGMDFSQHPMLSVADPPRWSGVFASPQSGDPVVARAIATPNGTLVGLMDAGQLDKLISNTRPSRAVVLADASGRALFRQGVEAGFVDVVLESDAFREAQKPSTTLHEAEGADYLLSAAPVRAAGWTVLVLETKRSVFAPVWQLHTLFLVIDLGLVVCLALGAGIFAHRSVAPLQRLKALAWPVVSGNYDSAIPTQPYAESEELAHGYRQLASDIRRRDELIAATRRTLDFAASGSLKGSGQDFFEQLVNMISGVTSARSILVLEWSTGAMPRAHLLAARTNVPLASDFSYDLRGNPCSHLSQTSIIHIPSGVLQQYPESPLLRLLAADGYVAVPLKLADGEVAGHIAIIDDHELPLDEQTRNLLLVLASRSGAELQRIRAERRVEAAEQFQQAIAQDQSELIRRNTIDGTITYANDAYCRWTGTPRDQLLGHSFFPSVAPDDRDLVRMYLSRLDAANRTIALEYRALNADGGQCLQSWIYRVILDPRGRIIEYQGTGRDVTEWRRLHSSLAELELRFDHLAANLNGVFWMIDWPRQQVLYVSPGCRQIWGVTEAALRENAMAWTTPIHEDDRPRIVRHYLVAASEGPYVDRYRVPQPDGTVRWIELRLFPIRGDSEHVNKVAAIAEDITERLAPRASST